MTRQHYFSRRACERFSFTLLGFAALLITSRARAADSPEIPRDPQPAPPPRMEEIETVAPGEIVTPGEKVAPNHRTPEPMRFGVLAGLGFPRPASLEAFLQFDRHWSIGGEFSMLPVASVGDVDMNFWAAAADARLYPFHGAFYVGLKGGYQYLGASGYITTSGVKSLSQGTVETIFMTPEIGFMFTWDSGMALGFGTGLQIPLYANSSMTSNIPLSSSLLGSIGTLGTGVLPTVDLLRVGLVL